MLILLDAIMPPITKNVFSRKKEQYIRGKTLFKTFYSQLVELVE